jgi:uncharacterized protein (TIGR02001 family)
MKKSLIALALVSAFAAPAFAEEAAAPAPEAKPFTANVGIVSNYIFRGISQTQGKPAVQGGFDYAHESGLYVGTWGSNVNWVSATGVKADNSLELDIYGGYKGTFADDFSYDVGVLQYYYPGTLNAGAVNANSTEVYASIGWKFITLKYNYTVSSHLFSWVGTSGEKTRGSGYIDLTANYDLGDGWGVVGHVGRQNIKGFSAASYNDFKVGVTKDVGFGVVGLSYSDTDANTCGDSTPAYCWGTAGKDVSKGAAVLSFTKTF